LSSYGRAAKPKRDLLGRRFQGGNTHGNEEESCKEESREEKEALTTRRGQGLANFFAGKTGLRDFVRGLFAGGASRSGDFVIVRDKGSC
jgi:hypothetical protein